ncbi:hypothetical protein A9Q87_05615 [Flavobacteriales bacterium 34_180_T64]|nr:hypothetical protein A9Q87_05615 [Flavobacteriales bacterium 34_180_T64]
MQSQNSQIAKSISFIDYGPIAFDSFWRLPDDEFKEYPLVLFTSRVSTNNQQSIYYTQYLRTDIPIGGNHTLTFRIPYHYFQVKPDIAQNLDMANDSGTEFGDIDIIFNISFLKNVLNKNTKNRLSIYLTAEMHTAPTGRENRQFTDVLKLLGTANAVYSIVKNKKHSLNSVLCIGAGGWDDPAPQNQNHAIKISSKLNYNLNLNNNNGIGVFLGETFISAEGDNNKGIYWKAGFNYWKFNGIQFGLNLGLLKYLNESNVFVRQYGFSASVPIKWHKKL